MTSLHELIDQQFGVRTRPAENRETQAMTTGSALVLRSDSTRLAATIVNLGQSDVFLRPRRPPTSTVGIRLGPNGGSMQLLAGEDFALVGVDWFGVTAVGTSTLYTLEVLIEPADNGGIV